MFNCYATFKAYMIFVGLRCVLCEHLTSQHPFDYKHMYFNQQ